jgi:hypothetical protein
MKNTRRAFILAAGLTAVTMSLHCETPQEGASQVSFQSSMYSDLRALYGATNERRWESDLVYRDPLWLVL